MRRRAALAVLLAPLVLACGGGSKTARFEDAGAPITFSYPTGFTHGFASTGAEIVGRPPTFRTAVGIDSRNVVVVSIYTLKRAVESYGDAAAFQPIVDTTARTIARADKARITRIGHGAFGPFDGYTYDLALDGGDGERLVFGFRGTTEYFLRCGWQAAKAKPIQDACNQVQSSFAVRTG